MPKDLFRPRASAPGALLPLILATASPLLGADRPEGLLLRSPDGRLAVTAVAAAEAVRIDGVLDEAVWSRPPPPPVSCRAIPARASRPPRRPRSRGLRRRYLYIAAYCHDPIRSGIVVNDIRKDFPAGEQDTFEVLLDTFADRRNGFVFATNAEGARADTQMRTRAATSTRTGTRCGG